MKKIITAIDHPKLNEELKKEKNFEIIGKDIQYREAILEILENNNEIDLIIISEKIPGEISLENIIEKIKIINENIKIIFILEKENTELEKILIKNNIKDIYYNNKIKLKDLIQIINKKEINMEEEIIKLKKIIEQQKDNKKKEKNLITYFNFINKKIEIIKNQIKEKLNKKEIKDQYSNKSSTIITFSGNYKSGKSTLSFIFSQYLSLKNYNVLLIDGDLEKEDLVTLLKINKEKKNKKNLEKKDKIKLNRQINLKIKNFYNKRKEIDYYKIKELNKKCIKRINKNLYFFYGLKKILENKTITNEKFYQKRLLYFFQIQKEKYDFIIIDLSKTNKKEINKEILKNSFINFICIEANILGIKEVKQLIKCYLEKWKIYKNSIYIIHNKKQRNSMNKELLSKYLNLKNRIFEIKENKIYNFSNINFLKKKIFLKNKKIEKEWNKIINKVLKDIYKIY